MSDTPRTDVAQHNMGSVLEPDYVVDADFSRYLERELAEAQAEIMRLEGEAESWEKVFDRTCEHLADAKEQLRLCNVDQFTTAAELAEANARLDWLDTVECGIFHRGYGEYRYYIGEGFTKKAREVIDAAMKEGGK